MTGVPGTSKEKTEALRRKLLAWVPARGARPALAGDARSLMPYGYRRSCCNRPASSRACRTSSGSIEAFPTVEALAAASEDAVLKTVGRPRVLHTCAQPSQGREDGGGGVRRPATDNRQGLGRNSPAWDGIRRRRLRARRMGNGVAVLDGNVKRVLSRVFDIADCIDDTATTKALWALAEDLVPARSPGDFNEAMMELGARVCTPKRPGCAACPIRGQCDAFAHGVQKERPVRHPKKSPPHRERVVAAIQVRGRYLIVKRPSTGLLGGLWELPDCEVRAGETHQEALVRGMRESLSVTVRVCGGLVAVVKHAYSHFRVTLSVYRCEMDGDLPQPDVQSDMRWCAAGPFRALRLPQGQPQVHRVAIGLRPSRRVSRRGRRGLPPPGPRQRDSGRTWASGLRETARDRRAFRGTRSPRSRLP